MNSVANGNVPDRTRKRHNADEEPRDSSNETKRPKVSPTAESTDPERSDDITETWQKETATFHVIEVGSGTKLQIEFFYDSERILFDENKFANNLSDVCFTFTRSENEKLPTTFIVEFEDKNLTFYDRDRQSARLRLGPFLAHHLGDLSVMSQGNRKLDRVPEHTVRVYITNPECNIFCALREDITQFSNNCSSRGIRVASPEPINHSIPTEVAALFSSYFCNIFYSSFKDSQERFVTMRDVDIAIIREIIHDTVVRHDRWFSTTDTTKMSWATLAEILDHCDRFSLDQQSLNFQRYIKQYMSRLAKYTKGTVRGLQEVSRIVRSDELMHACVKILHLSDCLEEWENQYTDEISLEFAAIIAERRLQLRSLAENRPKLRLCYRQGQIVCSLFNDVQPVLVKSLIDFPLSAKRYCDLGDPDLPRIHLARQVQKDDRQSVRVYKPQGKYFLTYIDFSPRPQLRICDRLYKNGWVVGVVTEGTQLLSVDRGGMMDFVVENTVEPDDEPENP